MAKDLISVTILSYNNASTLLKSLQSVLIQQDVSFEIVLVDDGSTDETSQIMQDFKTQHPELSVAIISNETNLGITKSRNIALSHSKGDFIAVLDSDDVWINDHKLKKQLDFLLSRPDYILVGAQMNKVLTDGTTVLQTSYKSTDSDIRSKFLIQNQFCHSSVLFKNIKQTYDESLYIWEDYDFILRLGTKGKLANIDEVLVDYLYVPKKYSFSRKIKLIQAELQIISLHKKEYPNFMLGYSKRIIKFILTLLHLK